VFSLLLLLLLLVCCRLRFSLALPSRTVFVRSFPPPPPLSPPSSLASSWSAAAGPWQLVAGRRSPAPTQTPDVRDRRAPLIADWVGVREG